MNKRKFLGLCSAILGSPFLSPVFRWVGQAAARGAEGPGADGLTNWAGNYRYGTDRLYRAGSLKQVQGLVKRHGKLKVLGTRHCFNGIADSTRSLVSLRDMDRVVALDREARTVTVEAGVSYGEL